MLFKAFLTALSTYSVIPARIKNWDDRALKYSLCFLPAVGVIISAALAFWTFAANHLPVNNIMFAIIAVCIPLLITGGIHMDGYMDTVDALSSRQPRERKMEILKDSNTGAFAVIWCAVYLLVCFGLYNELAAFGRISAVVPVFVLSRALSAANVSSLPNARKGGMLYSFTKGSAQRTTFFIMLIVAAAAVFLMIFTDGLTGLFAAIAAFITVFCYRKMVMKQFGGTTGDTAGFFLQVCEGACLFGAWIGAMLQGLF